MPIQDRWWTTDDEGRKVRTPRYGQGLQFRAYHRGADKKQRSKSFKRKLDANRWLEDQSAAKNRGEWIGPERARATVADVWESWLPTKSLKPSTLETYERLWVNQIEPTFGSKPLNQVTFSAISAWVSDLRRTGKAGPDGSRAPLSASRTRQAHRVLSMVLEHAVREQRITRNPAEHVELPKLPPKGERDYLTRAQLMQLADACAAPARPGGSARPMYRTLVLVLGTTGIRWGEMAGLTPADVDPLRRVIHVRRSVTEVNGTPVTSLPKNGKRREVPLLEVAREGLIDLMAGRSKDEPIFASPEGARIRSSNFRRRAFDAARLAIGKPELVPHELRHTAASLAISSGASIKAVQEMLGHASAAMTLDIYGHLYADELDALRVRLDEAFGSTTPDAESTVAEIRPAMGE
jgi:integrase